MFYSSVTSSFCPSVAAPTGLGASGSGRRGAVAVGLVPPFCSELVPNSEIPSACRGGLVAGLRVGKATGVVYLPRAGDFVYSGG